MSTQQASPSAVRQENNGPPCRRCRGRSWDVERQAKGRLRWLAETIVAAPEVWIFQGESPGWPEKEYEVWTCQSCGRRARV